MFFIAPADKSSMNKFLETMTVVMKEKKINQTELAKITDISVLTIRSWIARDNVPDVLTAAKIAEALNTSLDFLATGKPSATDEFDKLKSKLDAIKLIVES